MEDKEKIAECCKEIYQGMIAKDSDMLEQSRVNAAVFGGGRHVWRLQLKSTIIKRKGCWYIGEATAATY